MKLCHKIILKIIMLIKIYTHFIIIDTSRNYIFMKEYKLRLIILIFKRHKNIKLKHYDFENIRHIVYEMLFV